MNEETPTPEHPQLSTEELEHLIREGDPPLTRRELRQRYRAEEAGLLTRVDGQLVIAEQQATPAAPAKVDEPPTVTSADVLAGKVPAASGLTRRELRELAAQHAAEEEADNTVDTGELEETLESESVSEPAEPVRPAPSTPQRISTKVVASELEENQVPPAPETGAEQTARRPVVRPDGAQTGEYTGEYDQIRRAMADINAAPDTPAPDTPAPPAPRRRSVFEASVPAELTADPADEESPAEETDAADWTAVIDAPVVTDDLLPNLEPVEAAVPQPADPEPETAEDPEVSPEGESGIPRPGDEKFNFPDWHTLTSIPAVPETTDSEPPAAASEASEPKRSGSPMWLTALQWLVIAVVAVVLGLLVWYAINRGFGSGTEGAAGILTPLYHLRV